MSTAPLLKHETDYTAYRITAEDTVRLVPLTGPSDGSPTSVFFEIWDPQGVQPDNSHPESVEIFVFLQGTGIAYSDEHSVEVTAGDVIVLPVGSVHHIKNTSSTDRLYAVTVMANDLGSQPDDSTVTGFHELVLGGVVDGLDDADRSVLFANAGTIGHYTH
ncbi:cupin domain-containing protein [Subtercola frigoramans]|uniref:Mannose-6-phosphate isomerase-like protein (Cupin superfamily) n=1 Tax=Subtercola frigoramans TaxID=120298 RepID=A0ABS2L2I0_9MICO|nr:cupin domain-containing protein [Subtercola frigoramans]MBM7471111.1 mannose-6-phosphate isomerase-like protein (cupin superfamily) [Subtercola frigoramans]